MFEHEKLLRSVDDFENIERIWLICLFSLLLVASVGFSGQLFAGI